MSEWRIPLFRINSDENDIEAVSNIIRRRSFWADGPEIKEFEEKLKDFSGRKHAVVFNSGTSALHSLLLAYGLKNSEIIVPSFTFISTANSVVLAGAKPVFADIEEGTMGLDVEDVKKKVTDKTKAIILVHYAGFPAKDTIALRELAKEKELLLIEDAAEAMGAKIDDKMVGSFGDAGMYSFCQNKIISTGEGGCIVTDDAIVAEKLKIIRSHGRIDSKEGYFSSTESGDYLDVGYNYRMPAMCAALGVSQIRRIQDLIELRQKKASLFNKGLDLEGVRTPKSQGISVYQMYPVLFEDQETREKVQNLLKSKGIMAKVYFDPIHLTSVYEEYGYKEGDLPQTESISGRILSLPFGPDMPEQEIEEILGLVKSCVG